MTFMAIDHWGRSGWTFIHACSYAYSAAPTAEERSHMHAFIRSVGHVLPCATCRRHYAQFMERALARGAESDSLRGRDALTRTIVDLHNEVNRRAGKPIVAYEEVCAMYAPPDAGETCSASGGVSLSASASPWSLALLYLVMSALVALIVVSSVGRVLRCRTIGASRAYDGH